MIPVSFNGQTFNIPSRLERGWGASLNAFFEALAQNALSKNGGSFTLSNDIDFGSNKGIIAAYVTSKSANPSLVGVLRLANNEGIGWRSADGSQTFMLKLNASDQLELNGVVIGDAADIAALELAVLDLDTRLDAAESAIAGIPTATETYTNKTLTAPIINDYADFNEEADPTDPPAGKLRFWPGTDGKFYQKNSAGLKKVVGGGGLSAVSKTATYSAVSGDMVEANTTAGGFTVNLPSGTSAAAVGVMDSHGKFQTNNLIVAPATGHSIDSGAANDTITMDVNYANAIFYREEGATVWRMQRGSMTLYSPGSVPGYTGGQAIAQYNVGEKVTWTSPPATQNLTTTEADWTNASITLTPGVWMVCASIMAHYVTGTSAGSQGYTSIKITDSSNVIVQEMDKLIWASNEGAYSGWMLCATPFSFVANVSTNTTYKIRGAKLDSAGVGGGQLRNEGGARSQFFAVRIA